MYSYRKEVPEGVFLKFNTVIKSLEPVPSGQSRPAHPSVLLSIGPPTTIEEKCL